MRGASWVIALTGILACACGKGEEEKEPFGSATVTVADAGGSNLEGKTFVPKTVSMSVGKQCSGGLPGVSKGSCVSYLAGRVEAEGQSLDLRLWSDGVDDDEQARRVTGGSMPAVSEVSFRQGTGTALSDDFRTWNETNATKLERATVSVTADGRVTYDIAAVLEPSKFSKATGTVRLEASITIDCKPDGPNAARCGSNGGPPRQ